MNCPSDDAATGRRRYGIDMPDPQPPVRYCIYWEDHLTARIRQHYSILAAARALLYAAEDDANAIGDARRGYSRIMPHQEWAPYEIYEVTWHYQPATE